MTQPPLVSICIPTYNGAKYLEETLNCAINQTYPNIEIIITDDQSTDNTLEICNNFAKKDPRIKIIQNEKNLGLLGNWCEVVNKTSQNSEWIKFLFQDDLMDLFTVEKMINCALSSDVDFVLTNREYFFEQSVSKQTKKNYGNIPKTGNILKKSKKYTPEETATLISEYFFHNCLGEPPCFLFKRDKYKHSDYPTEFIQLIDYAFILEKILDNEFYFLNEKLIKFRVHNNSQSSKNSNTQTTSTKEIQKKITVQYYERIKLCFFILNNSKYKRVKDLLGENEILNMASYLIYKVYYTNKKHSKTIATYFAQTELNKFTYVSKTKGIIFFIKYKILKSKTKQFRQKQKL